jgi:hypothetical protein
MGAPFSELPKNDMGRNDPRRMCFIDDMGVPEELLFMLWQASRRGALEEAARAVEPRNSPDDWTDYAVIRAGAAAAIRKLATETNNG